MIASSTRKGSKRKSCSNKALLLESNRTLTAVLAAASMAAIENNRKLVSNFTCFELTDTSDEDTQEKLLEKTLIRSLRPRHKRSSVEMKAENCSSILAIEGREVSNPDLSVSGEIIESSKVLKRSKTSLRRRNFKQTAERAFTIDRASHSQANKPRPSLYAQSSLVKSSRTSTTSLGPKFRDNPRMAPRRSDSTIQSPRGWESANEDIPRRHTMAQMVIDTDLPAVKTPCKWTEEPNTNQTSSQEDEDIYPSWMTKDLEWSKKAVVGGHTWSSYSASGDVCFLDEADCT
ncbi:hypothetical protein Ciccas_008006, partial [Cichlidogyrus casuarinus]